MLFKLRAKRVREGAARRTSGASRHGRREGGGYGEQECKNSKHAEMWGTNRRIAWRRRVVGDVCRVGVFTVTLRILFCRILLRTCEMGEMGEMGRPDQMSVDE